MSIWAMTRRAMRQRRAPATGTEASTLGSESRSTDTAIERIAAYIPAEVMAVYIAGFSILQPRSVTGKWAVFAAGALLVPVFVKVSAGIGHENHRQALRPRDFFALVLFAFLAYLAWTAAIPESPFTMFHEEANRYGAFCAVVLSVLLPRAAVLLGIE